MKTFSIICVLLLILGMAYTYDEAQYTKQQGERVTFGWTTHAGYTYASSTNTAVSTLPKLVAMTSASPSQYWMLEQLEQYGVPYTVVDYSRGGDILFERHGRYYSVTIMLLLPALIVLYAWFLFLASRKPKELVSYAEKRVMPKWLKVSVVIGIWSGFLIGTYSAVEIINWSANFNVYLSLLTPIAVWLGAFFVGIASIYCTMKTLGIPVRGENETSATGGGSSTLPFIMMMSMHSH